MEQEEVMQKLNSFLVIKAGEGMSAKTIKSYFWRITDFLKNYDEISSESLDNYIKAAKDKGLSKNSIIIYQQIVKQFIDFTTGNYRSEKKPKKEGVKHPLFKIVKAESYVDGKGILRVKGSHVPALLSWCTAARGNIDFNYAATRKLRKEHNRKMEIKIIRKVPGLKSKY